MASVAMVTLDGAKSEVTRVKEVEGITEVQLVVTATMIQPWVGVEGRQN